MTTLKDSLSTIAGQVSHDTRPRILARNTFQYQHLNGNTAIRLHLTDIIVKRKGGKTELNSGGWHTVTTKDRINRFSGYRVYSNKGQWTISNGDGRSVPFYDGIVLPDALAGSKKAEREAARNAKLTKQINAFVRQVDKLEKLPTPDAGDCWLCALQDSKGTSVGEFSGRESNADHLLGHIRENYLHGSLLVNAMRWAGYRDEGTALHLQGLGSRVSVKSALRRYLRRKLGIG